MYFKFSIKVPLLLGRICLWIYLRYKKIRYGCRFRYILLNRGRFVIVDAADYDKLMQHKWRILSPPEYALRQVTRGKFIYMHNEIMRPFDSFDSTPFDKLRVKQDGCAQGRPLRQAQGRPLRQAQGRQGLVVDHKDHCGLNNTRENLRIATRSQNSCNNIKKKGCTSKYKGVHFDKEKGKYRTSIMANGKRISLGYFDNEEDAAKAYDKAARELHGEFAVLNFG